MSSSISIFRLPNEILSLIFDYLPQNDLVTTRLVCKTWCQKVDALAVFSIKFNDSLIINRPNYVNRLLSLRVRTCEIIPFSFPHNSFKISFHYPLLVKKLILTIAIDENVRKLISICTNIEVFKMYTTLYGDHSFNIDSRSQNNNLLGQLKKLKEVEICVQNFFNRSPTKKSPVFEAFTDPLLRLPSLQRVSINFHMLPNEWIRFFNFLLRHAQTLTSLYVHCFCESHSEKNNCDFYAHLSSPLRNLKLRTLEISCQSGLEVSPLHGIFVNILEGQTRLQKLVLDIFGDVSLVKKVQRVIWESREDLRHLELKLDELSCALTKEITFLEDESCFERQLSGELLKECKNLQTLSLCCTQSFFIYIDLHVKVGNNCRCSVGRIESGGWDLLPNSLQKLSLRGCNVRNSDLISLATSNFHSLSYLSIFNDAEQETCSSGVELPKTRLDYTTIKTLVEELKNLREFYFQIPFTSEDEEELITQMTGLAERLGVIGRRLPSYYKSNEQPSEFFFKFNNKEHREDFVQQLHSILSLTHTWNPPIPLHSGRARKFFFSSRV